MKIQVKTSLKVKKVKVHVKTSLKKWKFELKLHFLVKTNSRPGLCNHSGPQLGPQPDV